MDINTNLEGEGLSAASVSLNDMNIAYSPRTNRYRDHIQSARLDEA